MRVVGDGSQRSALEELIRAERIAGCELAGWQADVASEFGIAGMMLASTPNEGLGLAVAEAMSAGVPVVATAAGGHLELLGPYADVTGFPVGDAHVAATILRRLAAADDLRRELSAVLRSRQRELFSVERCVTQLLAEYCGSGTSGKWIEGPRVGVKLR
jgi:glycosyltransferase involved in cell wall biosynthesis